MTKSYITIVEKTPSSAQRYNRPEHKVVIHLNWQWHFASFYNVEQLKEFCDYVGITYHLTEEKETIENGKMQIYEVKQNLINNEGFTKLDQIPDSAKPIKALSNGSIVDCFILNDGENITVFRPNPNYKDVYKPLTIAEHIEHVKAHGVF